ncbi:MAG: hypothetical protein JKY08_05495 [Flavobacteriaceae bacterium]|nr:hypothetical protein [Flavobacteriaceae bacterium]
MDMWRVNKLLIIVVFIFLGCNNHLKKDDPCGLMNVMGIGGNILFDNFKEIETISFEALNNPNDNEIYLKDKLEIHEKKTLILEINQKTSQIIENGCYVTINDSLKYKITDVEFIKVERFGMWGSVGFSCNLKQYKVNDSLVDNQQTIVIKNDITF